MTEDNVELVAKFIVVWKHMPVYYFGCTISNIILKRYASLFCVIDPQKLVNSIDDPIASGRNAVFSVVRVGVYNNIFAKHINKTLVALLHVRIS